MAIGISDMSYPYGISHESMLMFMKGLCLITHVFLLQTQALTVTLIQFSVSVAFMAPPLCLISA